MVTFVCLCSFIGFYLQWDFNFSVTYALTSLTYRSNVNIYQSMLEIE